MATMTKQRRDSLVQEYYRLEDEFRQLAVGGASRDDIKVPKDAMRATLQQYWDELPRVTLSRCPFTAEPFVKAFDPWGLDGFWWQQMKIRSTKEPPPPQTFQVLQGALHLNGLPPLGGREGSQVGPEVPFVIPKVLNLPSMIAVISSIRLECGYTAFPIVYYSMVSQVPISLTQGWRESTYTYINQQGKPCWTIKTDPWDFDLKPWVEQGKVKWIEPGDDQFEVKGLLWDRYPFKDLQGRKEQQIITGTKLTLEPPPNNEEVEPFE